MGHMAHVCCICDEGLSLVRSAAWFAAQRGSRTVAITRPGRAIPTRGDDNGLIRLQNSLSQCIVRLVVRSPTGSPRYPLPHHDLPLR